MKRLLIFLLSFVSVYSAIGQHTDVPRTSNSILGVLYAKNSWANLTDFTVNNALSASVSSGQIVFTGGSAANYTNNLTLTSYGKSLLEQNRMFMRFKVDSAKASTAAGPYLAYISTALSTPLSLYAYCDLSLGGTGRVYLYDKFDGAILDSSLNSIIFSTNDVLEYSFERTQGNTYVVTARDSTTNSVPIQFTWVDNTIFSNASQAVSNTGYYAMGNRGGLYNIDSFSVTSNVIKNPLWMWIGDSKTFGYGAPWWSRTANLFQQFNSSLVVSAGPGNRTSDALSMVQEIISLHPQNAILSLIANDPDSNTTKTNYIALYDSLINHGINVYHVWYYQANEIWFYNWLFVNFPAKFIVPLTALANNGALNVDGVHPTSLGDTLAINQIMGSGKFEFLNNKNTIPLDATETVRGWLGVYDKSFIDTLQRFGDITKSFLVQQSTGPIAVQDKFITANTADIAGRTPSPVSGGGVWVNVGSGGTAGVEQDSLYAAVSANVQYHVATGIGVNQDVSWIVANKTTTSGGGSNLIGLFTTNNTFLQLISTCNSCGATNFSIQALTAGVATTLYTGSATVNNGDTIHLRTYNGTAYAYQNSTLLGSAPYNTSIFTGTAAGFGIFNDTASKFFNFQVSDASNPINYAWVVPHDATLSGNGTIASPLSVSSGTGSPGGSNTYVQYNNSGVFGGNSEFTYTNSTHTLLTPLVNISPVGTAATGLTITNAAGYSTGTGLLYSGNTSSTYIASHTNASYTGGVLHYIQNQGTGSGDYAQITLESKGTGASASASTYLVYRNDNQSTLKDWNTGNNASTGNFDISLNTAGALTSGTAASFTRNKNFLVGTVTDNNGFLQTGANTTTNASMFFNGAAVDVTSPTNGMLWYNSTAHTLNFRDNGSTTNLLGFSSGTYTPTLTNTTNITSSTLTQATYLKIGNTVQVTITGSLTVTTPASLVTLTVSLPFTTATTTQNYTVSGSAGINGSTSFSSAQGSVNSGTTATWNYIAVSATSDNFTINIQYKL